MSNILKVTTPVTGYDQAVNKQTQAGEERLDVKNAADPTRIVRIDQKPESEKGREALQDFTYESNFGNFVSTLKNIPRLREVMTRMLFSGMANVAEAGIGKGTAAEIDALLGMISLSPEELSAFLKNQVRGANKMQGTLFDMLRNVMDKTDSVELKSSILNFLKKYNDLSSGKHIYQSIRDGLKDIEGYMFSKDREALRGLAAGLKEHGLDTGAGNARLLKEEIIPFLSKYISETKNMGRIRDLVNVLAFNVARYENGSLSGVSLAFRRLFGFPAFQKNFPGVDPEQFRELLKTVDFEKAAGRADWSDAMLEILKAGVRGEAGMENKDAFLNILAGLLTNESVYMPLTHVMLPMILGGVPVFSELWIDPDEDSGNPGSSEKGIKLLLKFDMKGVGFFDLMMYYEKGKMDVVVHYPDNLSGHENEIRENIGKILKKNKLEVEYLAVEQGKESIPVSAAFPKIFERRNAINVTV